MKNIFALSLITCSLVTTASLQAADKLPHSKQYWKSEQFLKQFNGSYRINASIEPAVSGDERAELIAIQKLMAAGKRKQVIVKLKASKFLKSSAAVKFNLGNVLFEEGLLDDAIVQYKSAISQLPSFRRAQQNLAFAYVRKNELNNAYPYLLEVVRLGSQDGSVLGLLGSCYQQKRQYEAALQSFRNAQVTQPDVIEWKIGVVYALQQLGRSGQALKQMLEVCRIQPTAANHLFLASIYQRLGDDRKALIELEKLRRQKQLGTENVLLLASLHISVGSEPMGVRILSKHIETLKPEDFDLTMTAMRYCIDTAKMGLANQLADKLRLGFKSANAKDSKVRPTAAQEQRGVRLMGEVLLGSGDAKEVAKGEELMVDFVKAHPFDSRGLLVLARFYRNQGKLQQALALLDRMLSLEEATNLPLLREKAQLQRDLKQYKKAIKTLTKYLQYRSDASITRQLENLKSLVGARDVELIQRP